MPKRSKNPTRRQSQKASASEAQKIIGLRIRALRELANKTQQAICDVLGVDQSTWSKWESGKREPDMDVIIQFCMRFRVSLDLIYRGIPAESHEQIVELMRAYYPELLCVQPTSTSQDKDTVLASYRAAIAQALEE